jgi:thioredoxin 2
MAPVFEQAAAALEPRARLAKLNTDEAPGVAGRLRISSIPTLIAFRDGNEIARTSGALPLQQLVQWINSAVAP